MDENNNLNCQSVEKEPLYYANYLNIDRLLSCISPISGHLNETGIPVHDEHLFQVTHQSFELWFKQILFEFSSVIDLLSSDGDVAELTHRLERVAEILKVCISFFKILETMTPLSFMEFRGFLSPSSGFQSKQFRLIENILGVNKRIKFNQGSYKCAFAGNPQDFEEIEASEGGETVFNAINSWLERLFDSIGHDLIDLYYQSVRTVQNSPENEDFDVIFNKETYESRRSSGQVRLSFKAFWGGLMVFFFQNINNSVFPEDLLYKYEWLNEPYQIITYLMRIDCLVGQWRHDHVLLVQRMIGTKVGTGKSSGYHYLRATLGEEYLVFKDFLALSSYIVPTKYSDLNGKSWQNQTVNGSTCKI